jgi:hypothetical protein
MSLAQASGMSSDLLAPLHRLPLTSHSSHDQAKQIFLLSVKYLLSCVKVARVLGSFEGCSPCGRCSLILGGGNMYDGERVSDLTSNVLVRSCNKRRRAWLRASLKMRIFQVFQHFDSNFF